MARVPIGHETSPAMRVTCAHPLAQCPRADSVPSLGEASSAVKIGDCERKLPRAHRPRSPLLFIAR